MNIPTNLPTLNTRLRCKKLIQTLHSFKIKFYLDEIWDGETEVLCANINAILT